MSIVISIDEIKTFARLKTIAQIAPIKERIRSFERKYGCKFEAFRERVYQETEPERFEEWDDFIEWQAYIDSLQDLESLMRRIENAKDAKIA
jgi:hypothetical protein